MKDVIILFLLLVSLLTFNCTRQDFSESITISKVNRDIRIDGFLKDKVWSSIDSIQGLNAPWTLKCFDQTTFKCFYTENLFCFSFNVVDETIITYDFEDELTVAKGDRVELFFSASSDLKQYYCVEIDPIGNILDYSTQYYRKFDEDWDFNQLIVATQYTSQGYVVEGCISLSELKQLGIEDS